MTIAAAAIICDRLADEVRAKPWDTDRQRRDRRAQEAAHRHAARVLRDAAAPTTVETIWRLEVEWDRAMNTGSYERHLSEADARASLAEHLAEDPPSRWQIYRQTIIIDRRGRGGTWPVSH